MKEKEMSRTLVIGDIHGGFKALEQVLERAAVTEKDRLIFLGDYVDGWSESAAVIRYLMALDKRQACVFLKGNHESLFLTWLQTGEDNPTWLLHGGRATLTSYAQVNEIETATHQAFLARLKPYYIDADNRLFVHAGFTNMKGVTAEFFQEYLSWDRTLWEMALALDPNLPVESDYYPKRLKCYSEIFIGHTPVTNYGFTTPQHRANVWNIDTGAAFTGKITVMDLETKHFWQSDCVADLYPNEKGRNS